MLSDLEVDLDVDLDEELRRLLDDERTVVNHYMTKRAIMRGLVDGTPGRALCGEVFTPSSHGGGEVSDRRAIVCPTCQTIYNTLTKE
ncbi:DUF3039 domain-containing protein [Agromyces badenianii]|uniref:DUF3039 domain-containing protein n=1 Tax=Agromyces badenianii TaxID=2080742 RepID=UPI000D58FBE0|nr:DUF3039 domain-containing protein [Agromyces badenianii]PWC05434.1 DUF3039 domain-containing protein [Agromyces badenianii]